MTGDPPEQIKWTTVCARCGQLCESESGIHFCAPSMGEPLTPEQQIDRLRGSRSATSVEQQAEELTAKLEETYRTLAKDMYVAGLITLAELNKRLKRKPTAQDLTIAGLEAGSYRPGKPVHSKEERNEVMPLDLHAISVIADRANTCAMLTRSVPVSRAASTVGSQSTPI